MMRDLLQSDQDDLDALELSKAHRVLVPGLQHGDRDDLDELEMAVTMCTAVVRPLLPGPTFAW